MKTQTRLLIANWKMNGTFVESLKFSSFFHGKRMGCLVVFCPPTPFLRHLSLSHFLLGAQDCSAYVSGSYTGDISAKMLKEVGASYVILGHSERRLYHNETDSLIKEKAYRALEAGLRPVICVGETKEEKESGKKYVILEKVCSIFSDLANQIIIAYEPIWCIGSGITPTLDEIQKTHQFIYQICPSQIIYGGSLNNNNVKDIFSLREVRGGLVGSASLSAEAFYQMVQAC